MKKTWFYFVYDFETGGLSADKNPITEYAVEIVDGDTLKTVEKDDSFVRSYGDLVYNEQALKITGITRKQIDSGIESKEFVNRFIALATKYTGGRGRYKRKPILVAHNGDNFDINFFIKIFELHGKNLFDYFEKHIEDTMWMSRQLWQSEDDGNYKYNLEACCTRANVSLIDAHRAANDVEATTKLFRYLIERLRNSNVLIEEKDTRLFREKVDFKF